MWPHASIEELGDQALLIRLGEDIDPALNARVHALAARLRELPEALEVVPAFASVALCVTDPAQLTDDLRTRVAQLIHTLPDTTTDHRIQPVAYELPVDFAAGADLIEAASTLGMSTDTLIEKLCAPNYQVAMLGFLPGFAYLLGLDPTLALPRRASPRLRVPPGSLAIGAAQLGIYPCSSPGGWHLVGQVHAQLFDPTRARPALLGPGDLLRIAPV
jgi:inhibitor of KinA